MKNDTMKALLSSIIFDLNSVLLSTKEKYTSDAIESIVESLESIINDTASKDIENMVKRLLYKRMTELKAIDESKSLEIYKTYQKLKSGTITSDDALLMLKKSL